jgi:hypothetical protein
MYIRGAAWVIVVIAGSFRHRMKSEAPSGAHAPWYGDRGPAARQILSRRRRAA